MAEEYTVTYLGHSACAPGVETFRLARPAGYTFTPGQFLQLSIKTPEGEQSRFFSHADAPADPAIELTTRLTGSTFKNTLLALAPGTGVRMRGPLGRLGIAPGVTSVAFLVGGVGVTPAHSIIRDAMQRDTGLHIALFYSNRDPSCIPYGAEFRGYAECAPAFTYVEVVEAPDKQWTGPVGYLTAAVVRDHLDPGAVEQWIVSGPPPMVDAMRRVVNELQIPAERVSYELFAGYPEG